MENNIYMKLQEARCRLQNMNLKKSGRNNFANFSYYELADFLPSVNIIFGEMKLYSIFSITQEKIATLTIVNSENPNEIIIYSTPTVDVELKGCSAIQGIGAAHTYLKRYLYMNALEIVENDMLDAQTVNSKDENIIKNKILEKIDKIDSLDQLNDILISFLNLNINDYFLRSQLMQKGISLGNIYDKEIKRFIPNEELSQTLDTDPRILVA